MDYKQKLTDVKNRLKKNAPSIAAVTGAVVGAAVTYTIVTLRHSETLRNSNENIKNSNVVLADMCEDLLEMIEKRKKNEKCERVFISEETKQEILDGSHDVWFNVDGNRFDLILHPED